MKKLLIPFLVVALLGGFLVQYLTAQTTVYCAPDPNKTVISENLPIFVGDGNLRGQFWYPDPGGDQFGAESLPGIAITHGYAASYLGVQELAMTLAKQCMVVLIYNYRGQGVPPQQVDTLFHFWGDPERGDLEFVISKLKAGPPGIGDVVDDSKLGCIGFSQGSLACWLAMADVTTNDSFRAAVPDDAVHISTNLMLPNGCMTFDAPSLFVPSKIRTPGAPIGGVSWDTNTFVTLRDAVYTPDVPSVQSIVAARQSDDELPLSADHPYTLVTNGWYDFHQPADQGIANWQILTPGVAMPGYPPKAIHLGLGGHAVFPYGEPTLVAYRDLRENGWLEAYLHPVYATPSPGGPNTPTPTGPPLRFEYVANSLDPAFNPPRPVFELRQTTTWPPPGSVQLTFYLRANGELRDTPPTSMMGSDRIGQTYTTIPDYNMATAIAENNAATPMFVGFDNNTTETVKTYRTVVTLAQDAILVGPLTAQLYARPVDQAQTYQVHIRLLDELSGGATPVITRLNACAWNQATPPAQFQGTAFNGEQHAYRYKAGQKIVIEVRPNDPEFYNPANTAFFITPYFGNFEVDILRNDTNPSNITLWLLPTNPGQPLFTGGSGPVREPIPTPTPAPPEPLEIHAWYSDLTNPGGWRSWSPHIWFTCPGGEGEVSCPEEQIISTDGADQSFTYQASDEAGDVATVTVSGLDIDLTAPQLTETLPETQTFCLGATLTVDFTISDALSGLARSEATFNDQPVNPGETVPLVAGQNTLAVDALDVAGNRDFPEASVQVNYNETLAFPPDGVEIVPGVPLPFKFTIADACSPDGKYGSAIGTLWLTGPDGVEVPAEWYGEPTGNTFMYDSLSGWYSFDADTSGLGAGTWTARAHLDDGNDYTTTFVVP